MKETTIKLELSRICCGQVMHKEITENMLDYSENEVYTCLVCGKYYNLSTGQLDEEELINLKENIEGHN
jgi:hypothetical protein